MFSFQVCRASIAAALATLFVAGSALAQGTEPAKPAAADKAATAAKKAQASTSKPAPAGKRLDFAPTEPVAGTKGVLPAATRPATGGADKQDSHCHSSRASDA